MLGYGKRADSCVVSKPHGIPRASTLNSDIDKQLQKRTLCAAAMLINVSAMPRIMLQSWCGWGCISGSMFVTFVAGRTTPLNSSWPLVSCRCLRTAGSSQQAAAESAVAPLRKPLPCRLAARCDYNQLEHWRPWSVGGD